MKTARTLICALALCGATVGGAELRVGITPEFAGQPLVFDALTNITAAGQRVSVTRLDFLLSNFALRQSDGAWVAPSNSFAFISGREGRTSFELRNLPPASYDRLRFNVGVPGKENHANPAAFPAGHPLNPNLNGLHWNWQGGYVFLALEGNWSDQARGYSWHVGTDRLLMGVEVPIALKLAGDAELRLSLDVAKIFSAKHNIQIADETASTHSRANDSLAGQLRENIELAFSLEAESGSGRKQPVREMAAPELVVIGSNATPYRFSFPAFFPRPVLPRDNPLTAEGVELGRSLFHEARLSINNQQSCGSCHQGKAGFTDGRKFSLGADGQPGARNAMPLFNLAWKSSFFWDGRAPSLREQVLMPIENPIEMHETLSNVVAKLASRNGSREKNLAFKSKIRNLKSEIDYHSRFAAAFGTPAITADRIARALEQFLLVQVSAGSKFDRSLAGEVNFTEEEARGLELFHTEYDPRRGQFGADCFHCHGGPLFQNQSFANNGLDRDFRDLGRYETTRRNGDRGKFAVPSLRNVARTAPYMHDGRFATLAEVVEHYAIGVKRSATLDPNLAKHPDGGVPLTRADQRALVAFLHTLTDDSLTNTIPNVARVQLP